MELEIAVPAPIHGTFTYLSETAIESGMRVMVPFGRRQMVGVVIGPSEEGEKKKFKLKHVGKVVDENPVYSTTMLEIARWISVYYMHPIGEVLKTMLPASSQKVVRENLALTAKAKKLMASPIDVEGEILSKLFGKRQTLTPTTLRSKLEKLKKENPSWPDVTAASLQKRALLKKNRSATLKARDAKQSEGVFGSESVSGEVGHDLSKAQAAAIEQITEEGLKKEKSSPFLLLGVTGSGKTEVYLRLIEEVLKTDGQALVMVPEISLTPQMTQVFEKRFPGIVAVVHSAMSDKDRWDELQRIRRAEASVLIGPRSAVFGAFNNLKLIFVDEEHDSSYKQATGLTYHGRDIAVLRGSLDSAVVVLGSATPSMETYNNAITGKYGLVELPERICGRPLPTIRTITTKAAYKKGTKIGASSEVRKGDLLAPAKDIPVDAEIIGALKENLQRGHQAIVLVNRRGYAYYLFSLEKKKAVQCPNCSISLTLHDRSSSLRCHYCDYQTTLKKVVDENPGETLVAIGYGSEKAEDCLKAELPEARIVRLDSDTVAKKGVLTDTLAKYRNGEIDILVGTQILAKGHDFPNVTMIAILEVDQLLNLPEFRAGERTFQLIVQASGRAGRAELPGEVYIQSMRADHPVVETALSHEYKTFAEAELDFRRKQSYPPFARLILVEFNSTDRDKLMRLCRNINTWLDQMDEQDEATSRMVRVLGPAVPPIETIRGRHRRTVMFSSSDTNSLRSLATRFIKSFEKPDASIRVKVDVDPQSLI